MTLQIINSTTAGATQDLSTRVFMASDRLGLPPFSITQHAEEGSVGMSTLVVDDPSGNLTLKGHRRVYFVETAAPTGQQVIGNTYIGKKEISRGDWNVGPLARTFTVALADANTLISRRIVVGADGNRPAETDVARVQWLQTTTEANEFNGSSTYISTAGPVSMDAVDYRGQSVENILNDCSQASGKNYWVIYEESLGEFSLWYGKDTLAVYSSTIKLANDEASVDDSTVFAYFHTSTLTQDPERVYSGTYLPFDGAPGWVYEQRTATGNEFVFRDTSYPSFNVKSEAKARARANRYNGESSDEDDVVKVSFVVPAGHVNSLMHGMRIEVKGSHWTDYTAYTWMRCLTRTVTQMSSTHYRIDAELSPIPAPCVIMGYLINSGNPGTYNVPIATTASGSRTYLSAYGSSGDFVASDPEGLTFYPYAGTHYRPAPGAGACGPTQSCGGAWYFRNYGFADATMPTGFADGGTLVNPKVQILVVGPGTMTVWLTNMPSATAVGTVELWGVAIGNPANPTDALNPDVPTLLSSVPLTIPSVTVTVPNDGYCLHYVLVRDSALNQTSVGFGGWDWTAA